MAATSKKDTLRVLGTQATLLEPIRRQAEADLGVKIVYEVLDGVSAQQKAVTDPASFDIYDQWFNSAELVWTAGSLQPIELGRIALWDKVSDLTKKGRLTAHAKLGQGVNPVSRLYVKSDKSLGPQPSDWISMLPTAHNVDSFGYHPKIRRDLRPDEPESWAWLLDKRWRGKVAILSDPAIGAVDIALALQAGGRLEFDDIGNMTIEEIDALFALLTELRRSGHFRATWSSIPESVRVMERSNVLLANLWSPAITMLRAKHKSLVYASPVEGYRGWHSGIGLSSHLEPKTRDLAYDYLNWWLSGPAGAIVARQGYYMSVLDTTKEQLSPEEWAYWYEGAPATCDLCDPGGSVVVRAGELRDGGSYWKRLSNIAVWNAVMDEHNYLVRRWNEFLLA